MNQKNQNIESFIQKPHSHQQSLVGSQVTLRRGSSLDAASVSTKRFSLKKDNQYQSMIEDTSVDSDGSNITSFTTTTTASSASSPASTSLSKLQQAQVAPAHQRQIQFKRRMQQQKLVSNAMMRIQHQSRSDQSSSDDGLPQSSAKSHRIASGIHIAHNKTIAPAGLLAETIEMKILPSSPPSSASSSFDVKHHQVVKQEDSTKTTISTLSPTTVSSERDFTIETTLSTRGSEKGDDKSSYKRSRSFHGKGCRCLNISGNFLMLSPSLDFCPPLYVVYLCV